MKRKPATEYIPPDADRSPSLLDILAARILHRAADIVRKGWTQHCWARDKDKKPVRSESVDAVCHCAGSALKVAGPLLPSNQALAHATRSLQEKVTDIVMWNDGAGQTAENVAKTMDEVAYVLEGRVA